MPSGKRKRDDLPPQQHSNGGYIPQQDGAGDSILDELKVCSSLINVSDNRPFVLAYTV